MEKKRKKENVLVMYISFNSKTQHNAMSDSKYV